MAYVIAESCFEPKDTACVDASPVDASPQENTILAVRASAKFHSSKNPGATSVAMDRTAGYTEAT
jgi:hypothetical protein